MHRYENPINFERFWLFVPDLCVPPGSRADSQRDRNDSKSREIFGLIFPPDLFLLGYLRGGSGEDLCAPPSSRADSQREINHAEDRSGGKGRATKKFRDFCSGRLRQKSRKKKFGSLAFRKDSKIYEILEHLGST